VSDLAATKRAIDGASNVKSQSRLWGELTAD
jgi:hypothetical protein